jgi:hypothetical protein
MIRIVAGPGVFDTVERHLEQAEQVGFFLADWDGAARTFMLKDWRPVERDGYEVQTAVHVALTDEKRIEMIKWAWEEGASLVEVHSHGSWDPAGFSGSDLYGFEEWVPHLWWRLKGRPYAALVMAASSFDALAWVDAADLAEQVEELQVDGRVRRATGETLAKLNRRRSRV